MPTIFASALTVLGHRRPMAAAAQTWPGWDLDIKAAGHWAEGLAAAVAAAVTVAQAQKLAAAYLAAHPDGDQDAAAAVTWLTAQGFTLLAAVETLMPGLITDGFLIGAVSGDAMADGTAADTGTWQPGDADAAQERAEALGVAAALATAAAASDAAAATAAAAFTATVGAELVAGAAGGLAAAALGTAIRTALRAVGKAKSIAVDLITRAVTKGAKALYAKRGIKSGAWLIEDGSACPVCIVNAAASPVPIGQEYPSGDTGPQAHPHCRCALGPAGPDMGARLRHLLRTEPMEVCSA